MMTQAIVRTFLDAYSYTDEVKETILSAFRTLSVYEEFSAIVSVYEENPFVNTLPAGTTVLSVHIPRTLTPLHHDAVQESYRAADIFSRSRGVCEHTVFTCSSWLLFPRHREMLKPTSNILAFTADYTLIGSGENEGYHDLWRLFDCRCTNPDEMPADTLVRRAYIDLVSRGERTGWGRGFILYS